MTFSEKGLVRAMKTAYREYGYTVAQSKTGLMIITDSWAVGIPDYLIPFGIKGLIVSHAGRLPDEREAIFIQKNEVSKQLYEVAVERANSLIEDWEECVDRITPTRLTLDGNVIWQRNKDLKMSLVDPDDMQILDFTDLEAFDVDGAIFHKNSAGFVYVEPKDPENKSIILKHLEQMQCIPVDGE